MPVSHFVLNGFGTGDGTDLTAPKKAYERPGPLIPGIHEGVPGDGAGLARDDEGGGQGEGEEDGGKATGRHEDGLNLKLKEYRDD